MIDVHCHILPAVDDGPADWDESLRLARALARQGITHVAATPHSYGSRFRYDPSKIARLTRDLAEQLSQAGIALRVTHGTEILMRDDLDDMLRQGELLPYQDTKTILLESLAYADMEAILRVIGRVRRAGYEVVFAHPEKLQIMTENASTIRTLLEAGVYIQINAGNLLGLHGPLRQHLCEGWVREGLVHLVASDAHEAEGHRTPPMRSAFQKCEEIVGEGAKALFVDNPLSILRGETLRQ